MTHLNPIFSVNPIIFQVPNRQVDLEIKVTAPVDGENLPVIIFSHGHGASNFLSSYRGYAPLADFFASHGFVVIQPTHLNSKALALDPTGPEGPLFESNSFENTGTGRSFHTDESEPHKSGGKKKEKHCRG